MRNAIHWRKRRHIPQDQRECRSIFRWAKHRRADLDTHRDVGYHRNVHLVWHQSDALENNCNDHGQCRARFYSIYRLRWKHREPNINADWGCHLARNTVHPRSSSRGKRTSKFLCTRLGYGSIWLHSIHSDQLPG